MTDQNYSFFIKNKTPIKQKILAYSVGGVLAPGLLDYFIISIDCASLWLLILVFSVGLLVILFVVARLLADKNPLAEEITLTEKSIVSKVYGEIHFKNIKYSIENEIANEFYFLRVFLKDGIEHTWTRSDHKEVSIKNEQEFTLFCHDFSETFHHFKTHTPPDFPQHYTFTFYKEINYL